MKKEKINFYRHITYIYCPNEKFNSNLALEDLCLTTEHPLSVLDKHVGGLSPNSQILRKYCKIIALKQLKIVPDDKNDDVADIDDDDDDVVILSPDESLSSRTKSKPKKGSRAIKKQKRESPPPRQKTRNVSSRQKTKNVPSGQDTNVVSGQNILTADCFMEILSKIFDHDQVLVKTLAQKQ